MGIGRDQKYEQNLKNIYKDQPNLNFHGFLDQFSGDQLTELLGKSWIIVNTSVREGLPTSFLEAAASGCAILSGINPDGYTTNFGRQVVHGNYRAGLRYLLADNNWSIRGQRAREYTQRVFSLEESINRHLEIYQEFLKDE